jgi:hypothetical protein
METHKILDRLRILNPNSEFLADLQKSILNDDQYALFRLIQISNNSQLIEGLRKLKDQDNFDQDCFSRGQLHSKLWLVQELEKLDLELGTVFLCAGWYATLATLLFESNVKVKKIRSFDIDDSCLEIAKTFNKLWLMDNWKFQAITQDIHNINFDNYTYNVIRADGSIAELNDSSNTIINTSCEHINNFTEWYNKIPTGKLVILQSNDYFEIEEHVNCAIDAEDFSRMTPMTECLYLGELQLKDYTRFMKIGYK